MASQTINDRGQHSLRDDWRSTALPLLLVFLVVLLSPFLYDLSQMP